MTRSVAIIANSQCEQGRNAHHIRSIADALASSGVAVSVIFTESSQDGTSAACDYSKAVDLIVAVGGDGTVNSVVQGMIDGTAALAIAAAGTGNDAARFLGHPHLRHDSIASWLLAALVPGGGAHSDHDLPSIDVGRAEFGDGSTCLFLTVLSTGFDTLVNERAHQLRRIPGAIRYIMSTLVELPRCIPYTYVIKDSQERIETSALLVAVGNSGMYGRGMRICPEASVIDGEIDITIIGAVSRRTLVRLFPLVFSGRHMLDSRVIGLRSSAVTISGPSFVCYADGERMGPLPATISVLPRSLRVVPAFAL
jgi:diacylglycerol kinase (ATP)